MIELAMLAVFLLVLAAGGAVADRFDDRSDAYERNHGRRR